MSDDGKVLPRPLFRRDDSWDPVREWTEPGHMFEQDSRIPAFAKPSDWIDWAKRRLASSPRLGDEAAHWPSGAGPRLEGPLAGGVSEIRTGQDTWRIRLDVSQFSPEEITVLVKGGFLEIAGKHKERQDEKGTVSRCFTRRYRLPQGVSAPHVSSSLSGDGLLSVEAPVVPGAPAPPSPSSTETVVPVQMTQEQVAAQ